MRAAAMASFTVISSLDTFLRFVILRFQLSGENQLRRKVALGPAARAVSPVTGKEHAWTCCSRVKTVTYA